MKYEGYPIDKSKGFKNNPGVKGDFFTQILHQSQLFM
jgi:hypothetical protein